MKKYQPSAGTKVIDTSKIKPDIVIRHEWEDGTVRYTYGNKYIRISFDSFDKVAPKIVEEFSMQPEQLERFAKDPKKYEKQVKIIKRGANQKRDVMVLDTKSNVV